MKVQGSILGFIGMSLLASGCNSSPTGNSAPSLSGPVAGASAVKPVTAVSPATVQPVVSVPATLASNPTPAPTVTPSPTPVVPLPSLATALGIKASVDLRANDGPVEDQFGGTCSTFGTAAAMDNVIHSKGIQKTVSERDLWSDYAQYSIDAAVDAASSNFIMEEAYWPINGRAANSTSGYASFKITQTKNLDENMNLALRALDQGHPLAMAIQVPQSMDDCDDMIDPNSSWTKGQHVIEASGYKLDDSVEGGGYFIIKNSWGTGCGMGGYQYYPFKLCQRNDLYCYFIEVDDVQELMN